MKIKNYEIEMLKVKSADAFIIHLIDEFDRDYIILIDAGNYGDGQMIIDHLHKYYKNPKINLAIVTHADGDHFGGFIYLLEKLKTNTKDKIEIKQFWVHDPGEHITSDNVKYRWKENNAKEEARSVLDCNNENLLNLIDELGIKRTEQFAFDYHEDFKLLVIGPTVEFYKSLVHNFRHDLQKREIYETNETDEEATVTINEGIIHSRTLDQAGDDPSNHNQSSFLILFMPELESESESESESDKKYLFMGDAGENAFNNIPENLLELIKNVFWLKIPHHGSKKNMTNAMINFLRPRKAYISTEKIGKYLSKSVVNALKKVGCDVYSTHKNGNMLHHKINERDGYSTAESL